MGWLISSMCFQNVYKFFYVIAFFTSKNFYIFIITQKKKYFILKLSSIF